ncbi:MAG: cobalamin biosynthesis protein [Betaproteobacteria bacterium]|nr:cobalamin biosynthesis protein [Betaproteobacteria bacterium]
MKTEVVIGLGCDRHAALETLQEGVRRGLELCGVECTLVSCVATIDAKRDEVAILELAACHGWPLRFFSAVELAQVPVPNPSEVVRRYMGTPAVSEAAALLAAGSGGTLVLEKMKYLGSDGKHVTVSIVLGRETE